MEFIVKIFGLTVLAILVILLGGVVSGIFVYFLWNWLMPIIFGLPVISFWQAVGLSWLSAFLTRGASGSSSSSSK